MGWGPVDWVGRVLLEAKFENKWTLEMDFFLFERPLPEGPKAGLMGRNLEVGPWRRPRLPVNRY